MGHGKLSAENTYKAKVTSKGQVTVPIHVRDALGLRTGDEIVFRETTDGYVVTKAAQPSPFTNYVGYLQQELGGRNTDVLVEELRGPGPEDASGGEPRVDPEVGVGRGD